MSLFPRPVVPRLKLDISWRDIALAWFTRNSPNDLPHKTAAESQWVAMARRHAPQDTRPPLACLSVRSAWDLFLTALQLPVGSEVLMSAITILDMAAIVRAHGLVPVPIDLAPDTLQPDAAQAARLITPRTRVMIIVHLFGGRADLDPFVELARTHNLFLVEDCAQAYTGRADCVDPRTDASLISFGPIKTATALGGAIALVRDPELHTRMRQAEAQWPAMPLSDYAARIRRFALLKFLSIRVVFGLFVWLLARLGKDLEAVLGGSTRAFTEADLVSAVRHRAPAGMLRLLARRLRHHEETERTVHRRATVGQAITRALQGTLSLPGRSVLQPTHWVLPANRASARPLIMSLRAAGFDCTPGASAMRAVSPPADRAADAHTPGADAVLQDILYLPVQPGLSPGDVERLTRAVLIAAKS